MLEWFFKVFTSIKLTVVLLALGLILVFWGTLAQVDLGLYRAQNEFFRSMLIYWKPEGSSWRIPIFPGGYLVGGLLVINLFSAHLRYYRPGWRKFGVAMIHLGIVLLLVGQFATDMLSIESYMTIREGSSSNYSESNSRFELAIVDASDPKTDKVVAIPGSRLVTGSTIEHAEMPFRIKVKAFHVNSSLATKPVDGYELVEATNSMGQKIWWRSLPHETEMNRRDTPSGVVELLGPSGEAVPYLVSGFFDRPQEIEWNGRPYRMALRPERYYKPFSLHLVDFRFDRYPGTEIPKNFSSRVRLERPETGETREVTIRMNEPLRYWGETFFQADWDKTDEKGTVLQVIRNPSWVTPYLACVMVAFGMIWQFSTHLTRFAGRQKST